MKLTFLYTVFLISFVARFAASEDTEACAYDIFTDNGVIGFPNNKSGGQGWNKQCVWKFSITNSSTPHPFVYLDFFTTDLDESDNFIIFDGNATKNYTGNSIEPFIQVALKVNSTITLNTSPKQIDRHLKAVFSTDKCLKTFQSKDGVIKSPQYVLQNSLLNCTYVMTSVVDDELLLSFKNFNVAVGNVTVFDMGTSSVLTGTELPVDILSSNRNIKINFNVSMNVSNYFEAYFSSASSDCSQTDLFISDAMTSITFPSGKRKSKDDICVIIGKCDPGKSITGLVSVNQSSSQSSSFGSILVNDHGRYSKNLAYQSTFNDEDAYFVTTKNRVWIYYTQLGDDSQINIKLHSQAQGQNLYDKGELKVEKQKINDTSVYILTVQKGKQVHLYSPLNISLPVMSEINVYDGSNEDVQLATFQNSTVFDIISNTNKMLIAVKNVIENNITFNFDGITKVCSGMSTSVSGTYEVGSENLLNKETCVYIIRPPVNSVSDVLSIEIKINNLSKNETLALYEGGVPRNLRKPVVQINGNETYSNTLWFYVPAGKGAVVEYTPNVVGATPSGTKFIVSFNTRSDCGGKWDISSTVDIKSPEFPHGYPLNANCTWELTAPQGKKLLIHFNEVSLTQNGSLQVFENSSNSNTSNLIWNNFGNVVYDDLMINSSKIHLSWNTLGKFTNFSVQHGFFITVYVLDCGGNLTELSGKISTPNYPNEINQTLFCAWILNIPEKSSKGNPQIIQYDLKLSNNNNNSVIAIHDSGCISSSVIVVNGTQSHLSRTNKILVTYQFSNKTGKEKGTLFEMLYTMIECSENDRCDNGLCMHSDWKCNSVNDCGDFSDEKNCSSPAPVTGLSVSTFVIVILIMLLIGGAIGFVLPKFIQRFRTTYNYAPFRGEEDRE